MEILLADPYRSAVGGVLPWVEGLGDYTIAKDHWRPDFMCDGIALGEDAFTGGYNILTFIERGQKDTI